MDWMIRLIEAAAAVIGLWVLLHKERREEQRFRWEEEDRNHEL